MADRRTEVDESFYNFMVRQLYLGLEKRRKDGESYTIEEIEQYTKENPNKVSLGDLMPAKNDGYLVYMDNKWLHIDDCFNSKVIREVIPYTTIYKAYVKLT